MLKEFPLAEGVTTRQVNDLIQSSIRIALDGSRPWIGHDVKADRERRRGFGRTTYVHGIHTSLRSTLVASYTLPGVVDTFGIETTNVLRVVFPENYKGFDKSDPYTRLRVVIYDLIVHSAKARFMLDLKWQDGEQPAVLDEKGGE